jgi:hypothetical protein
MYAHVHSLLGTGDANYPWIRLAYIELATNMMPGPDSYRPANSNYDLLGPDTYNYFRWKAGCTGGGSGCTNSTGNWHNPTDSTLLGNSTAGVIKLAISEQKHIMIPELGTHPGCPGGGTGNTDGSYGHCLGTDTGTSKDAWFRDLAGALTSNPDYEQWVDGWAYYNSSPTDPVSNPAATYDWQFTNPSNTRNNDLSCPIPSGSNNCWDGDNNTATGYHDSFVVDSSYNHSDSSWFVGTSGAAAPFWP